jgi:uncharacterized protein YutE (UPF0331/DUF86 family)
MTIDDVILNKAEIIERCLKRVLEIYDGHPENLRTDQLRQDAIVLNLERACQAAIDLAMRWVRRKSLGIPKESRDAFTLLETAGHIPPPLAASLRRMVGFRNIAIHDYRELDVAVIEKMILANFSDLRELIRLVLQQPASDR